MCTIALKSVRKLWQAPLPKHSISRVKRAPDGYLCIQNSSLEPRNAQSVLVLYIWLLGWVSNDLAVPNWRFLKEIIIKLVSLIAVVLCFSLSKESQCLWPLHIHLLRQKMWLMEPWSQERQQKSCGESKLLSLSKYIKSSDIADFSPHPHFQLLWDYSPALSISAQRD